MKNFCTGLLIGMAAGAMAGMLIGPVCSGDGHKLRKKAEKAIQAIEELVADTGLKL